MSLASIPKVVTFGETMTFFIGQDSKRFRDTRTYSQHFAGSESNVAIGLSRLGLNSTWVSRLGRDDFSYYIQRCLRGEQVDLSLSFSEEATAGLMFKTQYAGKTDVTYNRINSAFSEIQPQDLNLDVLNEADAIFISGITASINDNTYHSLKHFVDEAKARNILVFYDPNIRMKLWQGENTRSRICEFISLADLSFIGKFEAIKLTNNEEKFQGDQFSDETQLSPLLKEAMEELQKLAGNNHLVLKIGNRGSIFWSRDLHQASFQIVQVDPVGAGDAYAAGFITSLLPKLIESNKSISELDDESLNSSLVIGNAMGAIVASSYGDVEGLPNLSELKSFLANQSEKTDEVSR